ncbi:MAG: nucleotidyltransferase family protein [Planctomycetota bacterium]|jgi:predicted nucleotidyltransferase|nr:nucleotidyltransferase family protein [Planctomycetota bacterium]
MLPSDALQRHRQKIDDIMRRYERLGITNLRVFGSVARNRDSEESDIDFLIDAEKVSFFTLGGLQSELEDLLGVHVDLVPSDMIKGEARDEILTGAIKL